MTARPHENSGSRRLFRVLPQWPRDR